MNNSFQLFVAGFQQVHNFGIVGFACLISHPLHSIIQRQRFAILAVRCQRIQAIDGGKNSGANGNFFPFQPVGITGSVPPLMVRTDNGDHRIREMNALQYLCAHYRMDLHFLELFRRKLARLGNDVLRHSEFADVMQQCGSP